MTVPFISSSLFTRGIEVILSHSIQHNVSQQVLVLYDTECALANSLKDAYLAYSSLTRGACFSELIEPKMDSLQTLLNEFNENDTVVLIQSGAFQWALGEYRLRLKLFERGLRVVEHAHLSCVRTNEVPWFADSLCFSPLHHFDEAKYIQQIVRDAKSISVTTTSGDEKTILTYSGRMESPKLNIGMYDDEDLKDPRSCSVPTTIGGAFPVGEVISESQKLEDVNGEAFVFAMPTTGKVIHEFETPLRIRITHGMLLESENADALREPVFRAIYERIKEVEGVVYVREFGLGLNSAMGRGRIVADPTAFERQRGLHVSIGKKHNLFRKVQFRRKEQLYHIDLFLNLFSIQVEHASPENNVLLYHDGDYRVAKNAQHTPLEKNENA